MERLTKAWKVSCLACGAIAILGASTTPLRAQTANPFPQSNDNSGQELNDVFNNSGQGATSVYGLINRLQLLNGRSTADFAAEQDEGFQSAVEEFRQKQKQKVQSPLTPTPPQPVAPLPTP
jgi:hypothetical protein